MKKSDTSKIEFEKAEKPEARRFVKKFDTSMIVYIGVLTAMEIVLNRFLSINAWNLKIGFSFVPVAMGLFSAFSSRGKRPYPGCSQPSGSIS